MRIIYVSSSRIPSRDANSIQVMNMCDAFAANGAAISLVARDGTEKANPREFYGIRQDLEIEKATWRKWRYGGIGYGMRILRILRGREVDFVYGRSMYGLLAAQNAGFAYGVEVHSYPHSKLRKALVRRVIRGSCLLVATSQRLLDAFVKDFRRDLPQKLLVEPNAIRLFSENCHSAQLTESSGTLKVGFVGHLYAGRGMELVGELARRLPEFEFHIVGGNDRDIAKWKNILVEPNLRFHGFVPPGEVDCYRVQFDVLILPYQKVVAVAGGGNDSAWMCPLKLRESLATGIAVLASDLPAIREVVKHEITGLLVDPSGIDAWCQSLVLLKKDPELRRSLGLAAQHAMTDEHTWDARARRILEAIKEEC